MKRFQTAFACFALGVLAASAAWPEPAAPPAPTAPAAEAAGTKEKTASPTKPASGTAPTPASTQVAQTPPAAGTEQQPSQPPAAEAPAAPAAPASPKLDISGFVDVYYEYNFNRPPRNFTDTSVTPPRTVRNDIQNKLRNFDFRHNEFALNLIEVVFHRDPAPVGFQINLAAGKTTDFVHAAEPGGAETYKHILQAYATAPVKFIAKDDTLDFGKFVTQAGAEVIESKDNWNYTRSFLFAWAIPYYHMGLRYHHPFNATTTGTFSLVNGWNDVEDNNNALTYGASLNTTFGKKLPFVLNYYGGPELTNDSHNWRHLIDTVLTYNASDKTAFNLNFDYGSQDQDSGTATWKGVAAYVRHALSDRHAVVLRGEYFKDDDGFATGTAQELKEVTLTYELKGPGGLLTRAEFRYDWSNKNVFDSSSGPGRKDSQPTLLLGAIYAF
jgi:hypothetical protein